MKYYVCGFMFSNIADQIALIQKEKPDWQKNRFNGIGGKIEIGESPIDAMIREFKEETGVETNPTEWVHYVTYSGPDYFVYFYKSFSDKVKTVQTTTEEQISLHNPWQLPDTIYNLHWLIPLALDSSVTQVVVHE